jgi:uncharacterized membrane protein HdeD (DUF308 family)
VEIVVVRSWRSLVPRGVIAILFGIVAFLWPSITLSALVLLFGAYSLLDGVLALASGTHRRAWMLLLEGLIGVGVGLAAFLWTGFTTIVLVNLIALWAIATGVLELVAAVHLRREVPGELLLGFAGSASIVLGLLMIAWPRLSAFVIVTLLGFYALFFGSTMLMLALRLRSLTRLEDIGHRPLRWRSS